MHLSFRKRGTLAQKANVNEESIGGSVIKTCHVPIFNLDNLIFTSKCVALLAT